MAISKAIPCARLLKFRRDPKFPQSTPKAHNVDRSGKCRSAVNVRKEMAPQVGFEPTTLRLTAECSAIEVMRSVGGARVHFVLRFGARIHFVLRFGARIHSGSGSEVGFIRARVQARIHSG